MLKLAWPPGSVAEEERALRSWDGRGAVRLYEADTDRGVLLLERLDATRSLAGVPVIPAAEHAAALLRDMCVPAPTSQTSPLLVTPLWS